MDGAALFVDVVVVITRGMLLHAAVLCGLQMDPISHRYTILVPLEVLDNGALFDAILGLLVGIVI